ncbi:MAG TPA: hypothetical protein DEF82_09065 [Crocinitomicaceae bacterium]|nr:hypothetical protein [Crocinitomicaceae bacterium]
MKKNILIIGAGLAGLSLAYHLKKKGHSVLLLDKGENFSSTIAAGMVNPMVFRRMNKSWRLDEFMPTAIEFYKELELQLNVKFYHPISIYRCFSSLQEKTWWNEKSAEPEYSNYLGETLSENQLTEEIKSEFGTGIVKQAFWINAALFVQTLQHYFSSNKELIYQEFDLEKFDPVNKIYNNKSFDDIVFCVGYAQHKLPFFENVPIQQTKGQLMTIKTIGLSNDYSLNRKCFVIPVGENIFKVGATYEWHNDTTHCTSEGLIEIKEKLAHLYTGSYDLVKQEAGIRPTVSDRRPVLGKSHEYNHIFLFNGLGTKGYMMAPLLANEMADLILEGKEPPLEYNSLRFSSI